MGVKKDFPRGRERLSNDRRKSLQFLLCRNVQIFIASESSSDQHVCACAFLYFAYVCLLCAACTICGHHHQLFTTAYTNVLGIWDMVTFKHRTMHIIFFIYSTYDLRLHGVICASFLIARSYQGCTFVLRTIYVHISHRQIRIVSECTSVLRELKLSIVNEYDAASVSL